MPSFAGARAKLKTATQDLFRLSGGNSIPVEARSAPAPAPTPAKASEKPAEDIPSSARKPEASIMFSLEELMKANPVSVKQEEETAPDQLWSMQAATPLFGTAHDQALLTTPLKKEPSPSMDSMTMPSRTPLARRWLPLGLAIGGACLGVAAAGWWFTGQSPAEPGPQAAVIEAPAVAKAAAASAPAVPVATSVPSAEDQIADAPAVAPPSGDAPSEAPDEGATPADEAAPPSSAPADPKAKNTKRPSAKAAPSRAARKPAAAFNKSAAKAALSSAAAKAAGCGAGGAAGKGKVMLTFAPSGKVSSASLVAGPFNGKAAGACALKYFRSASIPAFSGSAVTVSKSFSIK